MSVNLYKNYTSTSTNAYEEMKNTQAQKWVEIYLQENIIPHISSTEDDILEIGCGWGKYILALQNLGYSHVSGIDISEEQVETAKSIGLKNVFCSDALEYLKKNSQTFDVIYIFDVLEHLDTQYTVELLTELRTYLKPSGKIIIQVPNAISLFNPIRYADITHVTSFSVQSLAQLSKMSEYSSHAFFELAPTSDGIKNKIRKLLWSVLLKPLCTAIIFIQTGTTLQKIFTPNILAVYKK